MKSHNLEGCPRLHYLPDKLFHIQRFLYSQPILTRVNYNRRAKHTSNSLMRLSFVSKEAIRFSLNFDLNQEKGEQDVIDYSSENLDSQNTLSLSILLDNNKDYKEEEESGKVEESYLTKEFESIHTSEMILYPYNIKGGKSEDMGFRKEDATGKISERTHQSSKISGKKIEEGKEYRINEIEHPNSIFNLNNNSNAHFHLNSNLRKGKKEENCKEGGDLQLKKGKWKENLKEEEGDKKERQYFPTTCLPFKREISGISSLTEGIEPLRSVLKDSKVHTNKFSTMLKEDFMIK